MSNAFWASQSTEQRKLLNLIRKHNAAIKKALKPLAKPLVAKVRAVVPVDSGALKKSIGHREVAKAGKSASIIVGPRNNYVINEKQPRKYAHLIEAGHKFIESALTTEEINQLRNNVETEIKKLIV